MKKNLYKFIILLLILFLFYEINQLCFLLPAGLTMLSAFGKDFYKDLSISFLLFLFVFLFVFKYILSAMMSMFCLKINKIKKVLCETEITKLLYHYSIILDLLLFLYNSIDIKFDSGYFIKFDFLVGISLFFFYSFTLMSLPFLFVVKKYCFSKNYNQML